MAEEETRREEGGRGRKKKKKQEEEEEEEGLYSCKFTAARTKRGVLLRSRKLKVERFTVASSQF